VLISSAILGWSRPARSIHLTVCATERAKGRDSKGHRTSHCSSFWNVQEARTNKAQATLSPIAGCMSSLSQLQAGHAVTPCLLNYSRNEPQNLHATTSSIGCKMQRKRSKKHAQRGARPCLDCSTTSNTEEQSRDPKEDSTHHSQQSE
jgi:hypothetical protein